jgi:hypothetical protein
LNSDYAPAQKKSKKFFASRKKNVQRASALSAAVHGELPIIKFIHSFSTELFTMGLHFSPSYAPPDGVAPKRMTMRSQRDCICGGPADEQLRNWQGKSRNAP